MKSLKDKIKTQVVNHIAYVGTFRKEKGAFAIKYVKDGEKYTFSGMWRLIEKDLNKRIEKIISEVKKCS